MFRFISWLCGCRWSRIIVYKYIPHSIRKELVWFFAVGNSYIISAERDAVTGFYKPKSNIDKNKTIHKDNENVVYVMSNIISKRRF